MLYKWGTACFSKALKTFCVNHNINISQGLVNQVWAEWLFGGLRLAFIIMQLSAFILNCDFYGSLHLFFINVLKKLHMNEIIV